MKRFIFLFIVFIVIMPLIANNLNTVESPTAGMLSRGEARVHMKIFQENGIVFGADVGLFDAFQFGLSFGGEEIIGNEKPELSFEQVAYKVKLRLINEGLTIPAIAIGVDTQGHGKYYKEEKRYDIKSKGAYVVASKNFNMHGLLGFDLGMNYTFEWDDDEDKIVDFFAGAYKTIGDNITIFADYSLALNDRKRKIEGNDDADLWRKSSGYLNTGLQLRLTDQLSLKLLMHDILMNRGDINNIERSLMIDYRWFF